MHFSKLFVFDKSPHSPHGCGACRIEWVGFSRVWLRVSANTAVRSRLGRARQAARVGSAARAREELRGGAGLTEFVRAVGLALVQVRPAGARAGLGAGLRVRPRRAETRGRGRRGGARPVWVSRGGGRPRGREAQGWGARAPRGVLPRGRAVRGRAVLGLREARARRAGGRARGLPEAGSVLRGWRRLPAPRVRPGSGSGPEDRLRPGPWHLRARAAAGVRLPVVGRRRCRERRGEAGGGAEAAEGRRGRWGERRQGPGRREELGDGVNLAGTCERRGGEAGRPGRGEKRREGERKAEGSRRSSWSVS